MFKVISIMLAGVFIGFLSRSQRKFIQLNEKSIQIIIVILLFFMGIGVGNNSLIMSDLSKIGMEGLWLALSAILGSILLSALLYFFVFKKKL